MSVTPTGEGNGSEVTPLVLVALDASDQADLALTTGARLATKLDGDVVAVHVCCVLEPRNRSVGRVRELAHAAGVPLFVRHGEVATELGDAYLELRACAIVASGTVAREVLARVPVAVAVAPNGAPDMEIALASPVRREQSVSRRARDRAVQSG